MDRLTEKNESGGITIWQNDFLSSERKTEIMRKLAAYEDTNLEPAEVEALKAENERLKAEYDEIIAHRERVYWEVRDKLDAEFGINEMLRKNLAEEKKRADLAERALETQIKYFGECEPHSPLGEKTIQVLKLCILEKAEEDIEKEKQ